MARPTDRREGDQNALVTTMTSVAVLKEQAMDTGVTTVYPGLKLVLWWTVLLLQEENMNNNVVITVKGAFTYTYAYVTTHSVYI